MGTHAHTSQAWDLYRRDGAFYFVVHLTEKGVQVINPHGWPYESSREAMKSTEFVSNVLVLPELVKALRFIDHECTNVGNGAFDAKGAILAIQSIVIATLASADPAVEQDSDKKRE